MSTAQTRPSRSALFSLAVGLTACQDYSISFEPPDVNPGDVTDCAFTKIEGTDFSRYDCNPVFSKENVGLEGSLGNTSFHAQEILGHPFYEMWYVWTPASGDPPYTLRYAISADGVTWEDHPDNPGTLGNTPGNWDDDRMAGVRTVWDQDAGEYVFVYQGVNYDQVKTKLGAYASTDGLAWKPLPNSPVMDLSADTGGVSVCWPLALTKVPGEDFAGFLAGRPTADLLGDTCGIYKFSTPDIRSTEDYQIRRKVAVDAGPKGYDKKGMVDAAVVKLGDTYYMFYVGFQRWTLDGQWSLATNTSLAMATSEDGETWVKSPDNPIPVEADVQGQISGVAAQVVNGRIHLWVTDYYDDLDQSAIGYFLYEPSAAE